MKAYKATSIITAALEAANNTGYSANKAVAKQSSGSIASHITRRATNNGRSRKMDRQTRGYLGSKSDGHPRLKVVWRGHRKLIDAVGLYNILPNEKFG